MTLDNIELIETEEIGEFETVKAGLSSESLEFILDALTDGLYQDKITAILREYTSNMEDAIRVENKLDKPYYIIFNRDIDTNELWISFKDHGSGISPDFMKKIFMNWGESTRRNANVGIGGFGIGSKSGLSYQNEIYITTTVDNLTSEYILYKTGKLPELTLLNQYNSEEPNGTTIKIQIEKDDYKTFIQGCKKLRLFKNLIVIPLNESDYSNDYLIQEHELFYVYSYHVIDESFTKGGDHLKICNGPVIYKIDIDQAIRNRSSDHPSLETDIRKAFNRLSPSTVDKIIIKADIGSLEVTLSRDDLKYTARTSDFIVDRVLAVDALFMQKTVENIENNSDDIIQSIQKLQLMKSDVSLYKQYVKLYKSNLIDLIKVHRENIDITWDSKKEFIDIKSKLIKCYYPLLAELFARSFQPFDYENVIIDNNPKFYIENSKYIHSYFNSLKTNSKNIDVINLFYSSKYIRSRIPKDNDKPIFDLLDTIAFKIDFTRKLKSLFPCVTSVPQSYIDRCKQEELDAIEALKKERAKKAAETRALNKLNKKVEPEKEKITITTKYHDTYQIDDIVNAKHIVFLSSAERNQYTPGFFKVLYSIYNTGVVFINASVLNKRNSHNSYDEFLISLFYKDDVKFFKEKTIGKKIYYTDYGFQFFASNPDYRLFNLVTHKDFLDLTLHEKQFIYSNFDFYQSYLHTFELHTNWHKFIQNTKIDEIKELGYFFVYDRFRTNDNELIRRIIKSNNIKFFEAAQNRLKLNYKTLVAVHSTSDFLMDTETTDHDKAMCFLLKKRNNINKKLLNLKHG